MLIPLIQWAMQVGIQPATARQKAIRGSIPAIKMGRDWFISDDVQNIDNRVKSGRYVKKNK